LHQAVPIVPWLASAAHHTGYIASTKIRAQPRKDTTESAVRAPSIPERGIRIPIDMLTRETKRFYNLLAPHSRLLQCYWDLQTLSVATVCESKEHGGSLHLQT
jgi:hypothetical protein